MRECSYIDGHWTGSGTGRWRAVENPSTGEVFAETPDGGADDADRAVAAARAAFDTGPWPRLVPSERRETLIRLADLLASRSDQLVEIITRDAGCPIRVTELLQVGTPIGHLYDFADQALTLEPMGYPIDHHPSFGHSEVRREPIGVCVGFSPYNFPLFMNIWKMAPAVAMGNTVVLKPSPLTPLAATELARACEEVGFPPGVINVVHGDAEAGQRLAGHPDVDHVSFTGSTAVGRQVAELAGRNITRVVLELGGKSPSLLLDDCDVEMAVRGTVFASMIHAGQACVATTRMLVPASRYDEVIDVLRERVAALRVGPADDFTSDVGPLISAAQLRRVEGYVHSALQEGAKVLVGGQRTDLGGGYYFEPTVLVNVTNDMRVAQEEIFGPVLSVIRYEDEEAGITVANDTVYGLGAVVWGGDLTQARRVADRIQAGTVWVNDWGVINTRAPFGGYKQSGIGRELGADGAVEYTEVKHLYTGLDPDVDRRPYSLICFDWS